MLCLDCLRTDDLLQEGLCKSPVSATTSSFGMQVTENPMRQQPRSRVLAVGTPEGSYDLIAERRVNFTFQPDIATKFTLASLKGESSDDYLIFNVGQRLLVARASAVDAKESCAAMVFSQPGSNGPVPYPTCHAHAADALDESDLLVGLSNGEIALLSLRAQLRSGGAAARPSASLALNVDGSINSSRCVAAAWVPGTKGQSFVTAHRDGGVYIHQKMMGSSSDSALLSRSGSQQNLAPPVRQVQGPGSGGVTAAAPSPDGTLLAVACKDGILRIYELSTAKLVAGFQSYYGGLLCCAWTPDGGYVATGGEDDLVSVYGMAERCLVAMGRGHSSWISSLAFDPWLSHTIESLAAPPTSPLAAAAAHAVGGEASPMQVEAPGVGPEGGGGGTIYRLASVGQDCQLCLWDVEVSEDALAAGPSALSPMEEKGGGGRQHPSSPGHIVPRQVLGGGGGGAASGRLPACITPSIIKAEMPLIPVTAQQRVHWEPLSDVLFTPTAMMTACHGANVKVWRRPSAAAMQS